MSGVVVRPASAEDAGRIAATIVAAFASYRGRLAALPSARGLGLARRLVAAVEDQALHRGLTAVQLGVRVALTGNRRFFAGLGYVEVSRHAHPGFDDPTWVVMRKALAPSGRSM